MSSPSPEGHSNPQPTLTPAETADLTRLEAVAQAGVGTYLQVGSALAEIRERHLYRDRHPSFDAYVRERWADSIPKGDLPHTLGEELLPTLRWLLTKASGTIGLIAYKLERRAADIDDGARAQLRDDVLVLEDELITVKALLAELIDWDLEFGRLLDDELPPFDTDTELDEG
jgi:hypothetical protein